eukprot:gene17429-19173_t
MARVYSQEKQCFINDKDMQEQESLYDGLPEKTKEELHLMPLGMPASLSIESFINEATPDDIEKHLESLRNKPLMLDKYRKQNIKRRSRAIGLSAKEKRELGLYKIPKEKQRYESFVPLHKLWTDYMKTLIGIYAARSNITLKTVENKLLKADYHGAFLEVASSKCRTYLNTMGIVIKETKNMFYIITEEDKVKEISCILHEIAKIGKREENLALTMTCNSETASDRKVTKYFKQHCEILHYTEDENFS